MIEVYSGKRGVIVYNRELGCAFKLVMAIFYVDHLDGINRKCYRHLHADELETVFDFWGGDFLFFVCCANVWSHRFSYLEGDGYIEEMIKDEGFSREVNEMKRWFWIYIVNLFLIEKINTFKISYKGYHDNDMLIKKHIRYAHRLVTCYGGMGIDSESSIILRGYGKVMGWEEGGEEGGEE